MKTTSTGLEVCWESCVALTPHQPSIMLKKTNSEYPLKDKHRIYREGKQDTIRL
jgi:hypothetical protein